MRLLLKNKAIYSKLSFDDLLEKRCGVMNEIRKQLLQAQHELERKYESPSEMIERLKSEGKSMGQIEQELLEMNRIQGVYDSVVTALRILES